MGDEGFLHWFAGFIAGEGHFSAKFGGSDSVQVTARLIVGLRADELDILLEVQERLAMGTIQPNVKRPDKNPSAYFAVTRIADCRRLIDIFDNYPLRAKKQKDYEVWREIVLENCKPPEQRDLKRVHFLAEKLKLVRQYEVPELLDEYEPDAIQLSFPE